MKNRQRTDYTITIFVATKIKHRFLTTYKRNILNGSLIDADNFTASWQLVCSNGIPESRLKLFYKHGR